MAKNREARNVINQEKVFAEYPKKVEDPDGGFVLAQNATQEKCIKEGKPFPVEETKAEKKDEGPKEYPKNIEVTVEGEDGEEVTERRVVRCKEEEHAVKNGKAWEPAEDEVVVEKKKDSGPAEYPKIIDVDGENVRVRNKAEELAALGEISDDEGAGDEKPDFRKMKKKDDLEDYGKKYFGVDLNKSKSVKNLIKELEELEAAAEGEVILEDMDEEALVAFAKDNYELELDVESGKEALIEAIVEAAEHDDLGLDD